jgi:FlaG/FlaF family flagellin (archaellin)
MSFDARKKKSWSNESGVSEIIGNILILMITVILFSSIMAFVQNMPMPEQLTKATFSAGVTFVSNGTKANLTITHAGGDTMKTAQTMILVEQDTIAKGYNLTKDASLRSSLVWKTGMTWSKQLLGTSYSSVIIVTVVDMAKHASVWTSQITGGTGQNPPVIGQRYTDSNIATPTPDPVLEWDNFSFFVTITDPDNDLNPSKIWIDTTQLEGTGFAKRLPQANQSGEVFQWDFLDVRGRALSASRLDGGIIVIHAEDKKGHAAESTFVMSITKLPVQPVVIPPTSEPAPADQGSGDSGMPYYMDNRFDNFGWVILGEKKNTTTGVGTGQANTADKRNNFTKDERVFIRVASTTGSTSTLNNLMGGNTLTVTNTRTGMVFTPNYTGNSNTYPPTPFYGIQYSGNAYLYESQFNTFGLPPGRYTLGMLLKNTPGLGKPQVTFDQLATIDINQTGNPITFTPTVTMSKLSNFTGFWGNKTTPFAVSSANQYKIYVKVLVQDAAVYPPSPSCTEIRIVDMTGSAELFGVPPSGLMISKIMRLDSTHYNFTIDLRMNNGVQWRSGTNSYTLVITKLNDTNEGMYSLATQVYITGAGARADFITGSTGMGVGNGNFDIRSYVYYTENNNLFTTRTLWQSENTPGSTPDYTVTAMAAGDVNGDGHKDLLIGQATSKSLILFTNTLDTFGTWQSASVVYRPDGTTNQINGIAFGDVTGDGHDDFAYGTAGSPGTIVIYNTTYGSRGWIYNPPNKWTGTVTKLALKDMTGDGLADLVVLAGGKISIYDLKYSYNPALKSQEATKARFAVSTGTSTVDFDVADINNDTRPDLVTADPTTVAFTGGVVGVNVNYYTAATGTLKILDSAYNTVGYKVISGTWTNGTIAATQAIGGAFISFQENGTGGGQTTPLSSSVKVKMRFQALTSSPDQLLKVTARIGDLSGNPLPGEVFYVWYSIDDIYYTPVITVDKTTMTTYQYALPTNVMNKQIFIMVTDSWTTDSGAYRTFIMIDHIGVYTDLFNTYTGVSVVGDTTRTCVRGAFIDGPKRTAAPYMEIVAAKDGRWDVYNWTGTWEVMAGQPNTDATMFTRAGTPGAGNTALLNGLAPTLFNAVDINGDGYTDILVSNYTGTGASNNYANSYIGYYLNLYTGSSTYWRYYPVAQWLVPGPPNQGAEPWIDIVLAVNLNG